MKDRPLLSFIVGCYNQEAFIREALEGVFAQTYSPLEIIISDDCSIDRTFGIAQEVVAAYQGPHAVRINRNETNLGNGGNINQVMEWCRGALVIVASGDDISLPTRAEVIYQAWEQFGRRPTSICSSYTTISGDGTVRGIGGLRGDPNDSRLFQLLDGGLFEFLSARRPAACGCSHAWSPGLFNYFGPLKTDLEDLILSFRSLAVGQLLYIREPLVKYRRHGGNVSFLAAGEDDSISFVHRENRLRWVDEQTVRAYDNLLADIEILHQKGRITSAERDRLSREGRRVRNIYAVEREILDGTFFRRLRALASAVRRGNFKCTLRFLPRLLPRAMYRILYQFKNRNQPSSRTDGLAGMSS
jgi:glycosyltransferase involved in cell wall biosynthesis